MPRIWRSPYSDFGHDLEDLHEETVTANAVYDDETLREIRDSGFDAIWVRGKLHHLVRSRVFPEFGENAATHLENLRALIARATRQDVGVYLYMQVPLGFDVRDPFWERYPALKGSPTPWQTLQNESTTFCALCTSTEPVKRHLREDTETLARELPGLAGVILITASEYPSHCYGRGPMECPHCAGRSPAEVISEVITLVRDGIHAVSPQAQIIAWNWSWSFLEEDPSPAILSALPAGIFLMADFERGDTREILGKERSLDEYSLSFPGPSKRFRSCWEFARKRGLPLIAKLQLGTTHELATVPSLPVIGNLYEKARQMRLLNVSGFMGCWNFGNMLSANTAAFNAFLAMPELPPRDAALDEFAAQYFPGCKPEGVRRAWLAFGEAMDHYPFSLDFIYYGPMNFALGFVSRPEPLNDVPLGRSWVDDRRGDDLSVCLDAPYTLEELIEGFSSVVRLWDRGVDLLAESLHGLTDAHATQELANARVVGAIWRSTENLFRLYQLRRDWSDERLPRYREISRDERDNLAGILPLLEADSRFGYHGEPHTHLFTARSVREKIAALERQLAAG